jgi:hypothetical protein
MYAYILYRQILCALNILGSILSIVDWARFHASKQIPKMYLDVSYNSIKPTRILSKSSSTSLSFHYFLSGEVKYDFYS